MAVQKFLAALAVGRSSCPHDPSISRAFAITNAFDGYAGVGDDCAAGSATPADGTGGHVSIASGVRPADFTGRQTDRICGDRCGERGEPHECGYLGREL